MVIDIPLFDLEQRIRSAVIDVFRYDGELLLNNANERSVSHKLAEHLQKQFPYWHVDCEYNRRVDEPKRTARGLVLPDIIVHRRNTEENLLVIEMKKGTGGHECKDLDNLKSFREDPAFRYRYGLLLRIGQDGCEQALLYTKAGTRDLQSSIQDALKELGYGS